MAKGIWMTEQDLTGSYQCLIGQSSIMILRCLLAHSLHIYFFLIYLLIPSILSGRAGAKMATLPAPGSPAASAAPSVGSTSVLQEWAAIQAPESRGSALETFKTKMYEKILAVNKEHGGPMQFLKHALCEESDRLRYLDFLWATFPLQDDVEYSLDCVLPGVDPNDMAQHAPLCVHIGALGFDDECTMNPPPFCDTVKLLADQILQDGFITAGDPMKCLQPEELKTTGLPAPWSASISMKDALRPFSIGWIKGMSRTCTLHQILFLSMSQDPPIDLETVHPKLYTSVLRIFMFHHPHSSKRSIVLHGMKDSVRGSIRRPPNIITITTNIHKLKASGDCDYQGFLKMWNEISGKTYQITGAKAVALRLILEVMPEKGYVVIMAHVSRVGWTMALFSEDNISSKKIYPGHQHKGKSAKWIARKKVTKESFVLDVQRHITIYENLPVFMRTKVSKQAMEETSMISAIVYNIGQELLANIPLDKDILQLKFYDRYAAGCDQIKTDIIAGELEGNDAFSYKDVGVLNELIIAQDMKKPVQDNPDKALELVSDEFDLSMKQMNYDIAVFRLWGQKFRTHEGAVFHKKRDWLVTRTTEIEIAVHKFLANFQTYHFVAEPDDAIRELTEVKTMIKRKLNLYSEDILFYNVLNWATLMFSTPSVFQFIVTSFHSNASPNIKNHIRNNFG